MILIESSNARRPTPSPALPRHGSARPDDSARFDLLALPIVGPFLRWRHGRRLLQLAMLALAAAVIADGLLGPQMAPMNLAGVLPWTHWRGLVVVALLSAGNLFCMACPFMLPRELAKRWLPAQRAWPTWLRAKWLGAALLLLYLWGYEALAPWDSPRWTAAIALAYFAAAFAVDGVFRGASFCKYVCPIGQFHFVLSLASPLTVGPRRLAICRTCTTHDCLRGNASHRGCELDLFQREARQPRLHLLPRLRRGLPARQRRHPPRRAGARSGARPAPLVAAPAVRAPRRGGAGAADRLRCVRQRRRHGRAGPRLARRRGRASQPRIDLADRHRRPRAVLLALPVLPAPPRHG
jgi:hypothetical protein